MIGRVARDDRIHRRYAVAADVAECHILDGLAWSGIVIRITLYLNIDEFARLNVLDADIFIQNITCRVLVTHIDGKATQIIGLRLVMLQTVDVAEGDAFQHIAFVRIVPVGADDSWVRNICPQNTVLHQDTAASFLPCGSTLKCKKENYLASPQAFQRRQLAYTGQQRAS